MGVPLATYGSYDAVRVLDESTLRGLLAGGDRAERIWAAWALAAILSRQAAPDILADGDISRSAGNRRHLLVILAGLGERRVIRVMAEGDPNALVRASGCQYLLRTWQPGDTETAEFLKFCLFADPASEVRDEILKSAQLDRLALGLGELVDLANDRSDHVRERAIGLIRDRFGPDEISASGLFKRLAVEGRHDLLGALGRMALEAEGPERVLRAAEAQSAEGCMVLLDLLVDAKARFGWAPLNGLASRRDGAIDLRVLRLLGPDGGPVASAWLVHSVAARLSAPGVQDWDFIEESWPSLADAVAAMPIEVVGPLRPGLSAILAYAESIPEPEAGADPETDRRGYFVDLRRKLGRLMASAG